MKKICSLLFLILCGCTLSEKPASLQEIITLEEQVVIPVCPPEMKLISGEYCTQVIQICKSYLEPPESTPFARCLEFNKTKCMGKKISLNFCMDTEEYTGNLSKVPLSDISWTEAKVICEKDNKRLCSEPEWTFACEGPDIFPYTTGLFRPSKQCHIDVSKNVICKNGLCDLKNTINSNLECISPFGIHNMSGNVDEWIQVPKYQHSRVSDLFMRSSLKGGHWLPVRNRCRPRTDDHDEKFHQISVGFRCCKEIQP